MAKWSPRPYSDWGNPSDGSSINNLAYGQRMGLMLDSQANRFFRQDPTTMVNLAQSNLSDTDMLETMLTASNQVALNEMKGFMESLPPRMQPSEFNRLPQTTRRLLSGAGYQIPDPEEDKPLWKRIGTWDWPLIPEEYLYRNPIIGSDTFLGAAVKGALAPVRGLGFLSGKIAGGVWENVVMKPSRFAQRLSRWGNYLDDIDDPWAFHKPGLWRESWNKVKIESDSFSKEAVEHSIDLIGPEATMLLRKSISEEGVAGVYEYFTEKAKMEGRNASWTNDRYLAWYKTLTSADSLAARTSLESRRLDAFHYSIRKYNRSNLFLPDATPENIMGKAVGFTGAMAVEILLDPTMYMGGFYVKIIKRARAGLRGGGTAPFQLHFWENMTALDHVSNPGTKVPLAGYGTFKEGLKGYGDEVMEWAKDHRQLRSLGLININLRAQARGQNTMIKLINETFSDMDEIHDAMLRIRQTRAAEGLPSLDPAMLEREAMLLTGKTNKIAELSRSRPGLDPIIPEMLQWHERARDTQVMLVKTADDGAPTIEFVDAWSGKLKKGDVIIGADNGYITLGDDLLSPIPRASRAPVPTLASRQGYWRFMGDAQGQKSLTTTAGGVDPEAMFFPKIGYMGSKWIEGKSYMRRTVKFGERDSEVMADMARLTANWMKEKTDYVVARVIGDVEDGIIAVSRKVNGEDIFRILNEPNDQAALAYARAAGLSRNDLVVLREHMDDISKNAHLNILDDGDFSELYGYYQAQGYEFIKNPLPGGKAVALRRPPGLPVPFRGAFRAAGHYYRDRGLHAASSTNGEVALAEQMGWFTGAAATAAAYYPAKFAEKLFSYAPRLPYIDVMDNNTAIREFKGLIDIGIMAHIPRADLDDMLRQFIMGNETQRWVVQTQFFLDFMGRSGALLHGGADVQEYIRKFIRHGNAHYSVLGLDDVSMYGVNVKRGIIGAPAHEAHLSRMNVIPDYRELAAVAHYMSWYRMIGWGLHLPHLDKLISRTWRPAVLLRLGYVFRNGGEELFSWWLREGPVHFAHQKMARSASGQVVIWDGYGRKVVKDLNKVDKAVHESILWKPISRIWRSFNEVVGIGDFAITTKAVKESIEAEGMKWAFLSADEQAAIFETNRRLVKRRIEAQPLGRVGRGMFEMGNRYADMVAEFTSRVSRKVGIPSRREMSERILRTTDPAHEIRIELSTMAMLNPTILDEQMKQILGVYDTYLNFEKNSLSNVLRQQGVGSTVPALLKLPIDYTGTSVRWVKNSSAGDNPWDKSVALAQFAQHLNDSPENQAFVREMLHFASQQQDAGFDEIAQRLVDSLALDIHKARFVGTDGRPLQVIPSDPGVVMHTIPVQTSHLDAPNDPVSVVITGPRPKPTTKLPDGTVVKRPPLGDEEVIRIKRAIKDSLAALPPGSTVRVGGAQGVDTWAEEAAEALIRGGQDLKVQQYYVPPKGHPESWDSMKGGAGPNRNTRMLEGRQLGDPTDLRVPEATHGKADATFAFHSRPGKGFGEGASQKPQITTTGLTPRGFKFLTGTMRGSNRYQSKRLVVPFSQLMDKTEFAGKMPKAGVVMALEGMEHGRRVRVLIKIKNVSILKPDEFIIAKNFNQFGVDAASGKVFVQPYDMHLTKDPERALKRVQQAMSAQTPGRATQDVTITRLTADGTPHEILVKKGEAISPEEYRQLAVFEIEYLGPRATSDEDAKLLREVGRGSGTEDAMRQSFSAGINVDEGANMGRPDVVPPGAAEGGRYRNLKKQYEGEGHNVVERMDGDQTVMTVHQGGTGRSEEIIPPIAAVPGMTPSQIVMTLLQEANPDIPYILRRALLTPSSDEGALALSWANAVDEVIPMFPASQRAVWEDLLRPPVGRVTEPGQQILVGGTVTTTNGISNVHHGLHENRVLSNLDDTPFFFRNEQFQTAEGAYQAYKAGTGERAVGFHKVTGQVAKSQGKGKAVDKTTNVALMREVLKAKYEQVPQFRQALSEAGTITHEGRGIDAFWGENYPKLLEELRAGKPRRASGMEARLVAEAFDLGPSGRSPAVTRMEDGKPTILFDPERAIGQYKDRTVVEGGGGASLRDDMGVDIEHFMDSFGPEGLIQLTPNEVTHPEKFLEVINEWRSQNGLRPLGLDETLDGEYAFMAYIWEHEMAHIRLDHPNLKDMPRKTKEMQANTAAIEGLGIPRAALNPDSGRVIMAGDGADRTVEIAGAKVEHFKGDAGHLTDVDSLDAHIRSLDPSPIDEGYTSRAGKQETPATDGWQDSHLNIDAVENARRSGGDTRAVANSKPATRLMGDPGSSYHYTGKTFVAQAWSPEMTEIKEAIERLTGYEFDLVLIQRYATGRTDLGRHFDRAGATAAEQAKKNPEQVVVSVNFGEAREFKFTPRRKGPEEPGLGTGPEYQDYQGGRYQPEARPAGPTFTLENGDILVMMEGTNLNWAHTLSKDIGVEGLRINLTFRRVNADLAATARIDPPAPLASPALPPAPPVFVRGAPEVKGVLRNRNELDPQTAHWLASSPEIDPKRISGDIDVMVDRSKKAYQSQLGTPEGQQVAQSMTRSQLGSSQDSPYISNPHPDSILRMFVPFIPIELVDELHGLLAGVDVGEEAASAFKTLFTEKLTGKLSALGVPKADFVAFQTVNLLNPAVTVDRGATAMIYPQMAAHYAQIGKHFPLVTASANPMVARAITETFLEMIATQRGVPTDTLGPARVASRDVVGDEFYNDWGRFSRERETNLPQDDISIDRGNIRTTKTGANRANQVPTLGTSYYGYKPDGPAPASAFGEHGLKGQQVFGVSAGKLVPTVDGAAPVGIVNDTLKADAMRVYKHRSGKRPPVQVLPGSERNLDWYSDDEWELVNETFTTNDNIFDFATQQSETMALETMHYLSNMSRGGEPKVFFPWMREVLDDGGVDAGRVNMMAERGAWWDQAPEHLLGYVPVTQEEGNIFARGWHAVLRNWFDGVVNPMIGAMVREPLFHHYLTKGYKQTEDIRLLYNHKVGRFDNLERMLPGHHSKDVNQQLIIDPLEPFIKYDWPMAQADPEDLVSRLAFAMNDEDPVKFINVVDAMFEKAEDGTAYVDDMAVALKDVLRRLRSTAEHGTDGHIYDFFKWAKNRKITEEIHMEHALSRAMTLTSAFIDDHRIRSQFQKMVGSAIPFWFAEDQFLRRLGRGLAHNPMMLRRLHLTMNAGVYSGIIEKDQHGNKILIVPGNEIITNAVLEIADKFPIVNKFFGGPLGAVMRPSLGTSLKIIPGYDKEQMGNMGFGPLLSIPINLVANRDARIRPAFEKNLIGGRFTPERGGNIIWQSIVPAIVARPLALAMTSMGIEDAASVKAQQDVIRFMYLTEQLPSEEEIAAQPNPELFMDQIMDEIAQAGRQYQLLQALSWFGGPAVGRLANLMTNPAWEWNEEFYQMLEGGIPYEEAYLAWMENIVAREGEFDPYKYSPFRVSTTEKVPFSVIESTQAANEWLAGNTTFIDDYPQMSTFFMPRAFEGDDDEYSAEARSRALARGLRVTSNPREFLERLIFNITFPRFVQMRTEHQTRRYMMEAQGQDTTQLDLVWDSNMSMFNKANPIFMAHYQGGDARGKRVVAINEAELLLADPTRIPAGENNGDILAALEVVVTFTKAMRDLKGMAGREATDERNLTRLIAYDRMSKMVKGRPWLNEIYYSLFIPALGDTWLAQYNAGLIPNSRAGAMV